MNGQCDCCQEFYPALNVVARLGAPISSHERLCDTCFDLCEEERVNLLFVGPVLLASYDFMPVIAEVVA